jgi:hypothetical protein
MPIAIHIEPEDGLATVRCTGVLRVEDACDAASEVWRTPAWRGAAIVWDFRDSRFNMSSSGIRDIARFILENQPETPPSRVAFVAPHDVDYGLSRMYEVFREDARTLFRVTRDYEEALAWVRGE